MNANTRKAIAHRLERGETSFTIGRWDYEVSTLDYGSRGGITTVLKQYDTKTGAYSFTYRLPMEDYPQEWGMAK